MGDLTGLMVETDGLPGETGLRATSENNDMNAARPTGDLHARLLRWSPDGGGRWRLHVSHGRRRLLPSSHHLGNEGRGGLGSWLRGDAWGGFVSQMLSHHPRFRVHLHHGGGRLETGLHLLKVGGGVFRMATKTGRNRRRGRSLTGRWQLTPPSFRTIPIRPPMILYYLIYRLLLF